MLRIYTILILVSFFLFSLDRVFPLDPVRRLGQSVLSPISYGLYVTGFSLNQGVDFIASLPRVYYENRGLREELLGLQQSLVDLQRFRQENQALRRELDVEEEQQKNKVLASVLGLQEYGRSIVLILDKGKSDDVVEGLIVVSGGLLVGRITEVQDNYSYLEPVFAVTSRVPAEVMRQDNLEESGNRTRGLVKGYFNNQLLLDEVLQESPLAQGDLVVTSGESGVYPRGLLLGRIDVVDSTDSEIFKTSVLKPFWELGSLLNVFIYKQ